MVTMEPPKEYPAFIKPIFADCLNRLQIHPAFTSFMKFSMPDKAFLNNCDGKFWTVKVTKIGDNFYFQEGWRKFIRENHIEFGDILVFKYDCEHVFDFKIIGKSAKEKEILEVFDFNREDEQEVAEEVSRKTEDGSGEMKKNEGAKDTETENTDEDRPSYKTGYINGNPYFVTTITENKRGCLYVPSEIMNDNDIKDDGIITLRDPCGRVWRSNVCRLKDGSIRLQGWNRFCKQSNLRVGDECVCEIVGGKDGKPTYIQVY